MAPPNPQSAPGGQVDLNTLVATVGNAVQAQNGIATNIKALTAVFTSFLASYPTPLTGSKTWDPASVANGGEVNTTVAVTGAVVGNYVQASFSNDLQALTLTGYVSAADTVTVVLANNTGGAIDLASGTLKVRVTSV